MTSRLIVLLDILIGASLLVAPVGATFLSTPAVAATRDEDALAAGCDWLERAIAREPERDDSFGMFMRGMRPKCQAMLEGLARKDNSVRADAVQAIVKEIKDLQEVIDAENGGPPPGRNGPTPAEIARQKIADEQAAQDKVAQDKAAEDKAAREKAAEDKAAQERAAQEKAAQEKAAEEAKKAAERDAARQEQTDRKATEEEKRAAAREERERIAAEKKAAEEAKKAAAREERERIAAEKKAAEEARKAAAQEERARVAAEKKAAEEERKAAAEREAAAREEARRKAAELVAEEEASEDAERRATEERARKAAEDRERKAAEERERKAIDEGRQTPARIPSKKGALDGTWEQPEAKVLDRHVKRTLNLLTKDKKVQGELYEEVWFAAPAAWIDASCGGNTTYRMVTTARVSGEVEGDSLVLTREPPRILTCTCSSRCTVETRRRGFDLEIAASGGELRDQTGVFVRPGTAIVTKPGKTEGPEKVLTPRDFAGDWETSPFKQRDRTVVQRVELKVDADGKVTGTFIERSSQGLPLASWKDRFCEGAERWDWVTQWKVEGRVNGRKLALKASDGANLLCTCPTKCVAPKERMAIDLVYGTTGATLTFDDETFERR